MECRKNMIEHTHFKKKKVEKIFITLYLRELEAPKVLVMSIILTILTATSKLC